MFVAWRIRMEQTFRQGETEENISVKDEGKTTP